MSLVLFLPFVSSLASGQQIGPGIGAGTQDARQVIRNSSQAMRRVRSITYDAAYHGSGAFATHTQSVAGEVAIERLSPASPLKAKFAMQGRYYQTGGGDLQNFHTTFDGLVINRLRPKENALVRKSLRTDDPAERKLGFVTSFFGGGPYQSVLFELLDDEPLELQAGGQVADYEGRSTVDDVLCHVVYVEFDRGTTHLKERWFIGVSDNLPRKVERLAVDDNGRHGAYVLTLLRLQVNKPIADSKFRIVPPKGYRIKPFAEPARPQLLASNTAAPGWVLYDPENREHSLSAYGAMSS